MKQDPNAELEPQAAAGDKPTAPASREPDAIYQKGEIVGRVTEAEVDLDAKEIRFGEVYNTDPLLLPDECEYQKYTILFRRIAYATKSHASSLQRGRILKGAIAEILGCREQ